MSSISFGSSKYQLPERGPDRKEKNRLFDTCFEVKRLEWNDPGLSDKSFVIFVTFGFAQIVYSLMGPWGEMG